LRRLCDQLREFEAGIVKWEAIINDPKMKERHTLAVRALDVARRGRTTVDAALYQSLKALDLLDRKEEIMRQIAALES
jgi:hypothetical protein